MLRLFRIIGKKTSTPKIPSGLVRLLSLGAALVPIAIGSSMAVSAAPLVETSSGKVQGLTTEGVDEFLGIPYAAPPVGNLRWRPPRAAAPWKGVFKATSFGNTCPQINELGLFATPSQTEDCLYLNVFAPEGRTGSHVKRAVMVWIYGGGQIDGESTDYDGRKLAQNGAILVSMNYRLGVLGFFAQDSIDKEGHAFGSYGLMDQQFALKWVHDNIAAFGGDPNNVTIFGQSAGAYDSVAQMVTPSSAGLFQKAIIESGPLLKPAPFSADLSSGNAFANAAGCTSPAQASRCLRGLSVQQILNLQGPYTTNIIVDGSYIPQPPDVAFASGKFNRVPLINGTVFDEGAFSVGINEYLSGKPLTAAGYVSDVTTTYGSATAHQILAHYPLSAFASPSLADVKVTGTLGADVIACAARKFDQVLSKWVPVYAYSFDYRNAPSYFPPLSFPMRAYHTVELQFLFPGYHGGQGIQHPLNSAEEHLSDQMVSFWTAFANAMDSQSAWPEWMWSRYKTGFDDYYSFNIPYSVMIKGETFSQTHQCSFWDSISTWY